MRFSWTALSELLSLAIVGILVAPCAASAQPATANAAVPGCSDSILIHSTSQTQAIAFGRLASTDRSVFVTIAPPHEKNAVGWTLPTEVVRTTHTFIATGQPLDEARVDLSALALTLNVQLVDKRGATVCTVASTLVAFPSPGGTTTVVVVPGDNASWPSQSIGTVTLDNELSLLQPYLQETNGTLHVSGRLAIAGLTSSTLVDLHIPSTISSATPATLTGGPIEFDIPADALGIASPYQILIDSIACTYTTALRCSYPNISLKVPAGITVKPKTSSNTIPLSLNGDGTFGFTSSAANPVTITSGSSVISVSSLTVDLSKRSVSGSGTVTLTGIDAPLTISGLGFKPGPGGVFVPTGTIKLDDLPEQIVLNKLLTITALSGQVTLGDQPTSTISANATLNVSAGNTDIKAVISGITLSATGNIFDQLTSSAQRSSWSIDLSAAKVVPDTKNSELFGHALEACDPTALPDPVPTKPKRLQLCLGVHLSPGGVRSTDDVAYGYLALTPTYAFESLAITLPKSSGTKLRFAAGSLHIAALDIESSQEPFGGFDSDIPQSRLTDLGCTTISYEGGATIDQMSVGTTTNSIDAEPRLGIGPECIVFALHGFLPVQLSQQSSLMVSSLAYVHSKTLPEDPKPTIKPVESTVDYLNFSGSFTSGNITVVFNSLGFRTFAANDPEHPPLDASGKQIPYCDRAQWREYQLAKTRFCAIVDVNTPLTLAATGAQNATAIEDAIGKGVSAIAGFFFGKIKL